MDKHYLAACKELGITPSGEDAQDFYREAYGEVESLSPEMDWALDLAWASEAQARKEREAREARDTRAVVDAGLSSIAGLGLAAVATVACPPLAIVGWGLVAGGLAAQAAVLGVMVVDTMTNN